MHDPERELANNIRGKLQKVREALAAGNDGEFLVWVIPGLLACAQRPLRDHPTFGGRGRILPPEARELVIEWVTRLKADGIRSIICLMHPKELRYYESLDLHPEGLLAFYREEGFELRHLKWADPAHAATMEARRALEDEVHHIKVEAHAAFRKLPQPVLLHCSAGIDRSAPVAAYIKLQENPE